MSEMNGSFAGSIPEFYDRILVPVMFGPFAQHLAERLRGMTSGHILEIAAGVTVVRGELAAAGFAKVAVEEVTMLLHASSAREAAASMCHGGLVRAAIEEQMPARLDEITEAAAAAIAARFGMGPIESPLSALLFTAALAEA